VLACPSAPKKIRHIEAEVIAKLLKISKGKGSADDVMWIISKDESFDMFKKLPLC
jgi:hypothetical protein